MQRKTTCIRWLYLHSAGTKYAQPFLDKLQWCKSSKTPALIRDFSDFLPSSGQVWLLLSSVWEAGKQVGGAIIAQGSEERLVPLDLIVLMFISIEQGYHKVINPGMCSQPVLLSQNESCFIWRELIRHLDCEIAEEYEQCSLSIG